MCSLLLAAWVPAAAQDAPAAPADAASRPVFAPPPAVTSGPAGPASAPATGPAGRPAATEATTGPVAQLAPASRAAASRPAVANGPVTLNFRDASLRTVLEYLAEATGLVIVDGSKVTGRVTLMSRRPVSVLEAVALLDTVLRQEGYAAIRLGRILKIVPLDQARKEFIPVRSGSDPDKIEPTDRIITQIIPIRYADAVKLKADLASLIPTGTDVASNASSNTLIITGTEATVRRIAEIIKAIDVHMSEVSQVKVFQLKYANATSAARLILDIFKEDQSSTSGPTFFGGFGRRRSFVFPGGPAPGGGQENAEEKGARNVKVMASADERTNTLVVSAAPDVLKVIEGVVKDIDSNPAEQRAVFIYHVKNGNAKNMEAVLNSIFDWTGTTSSSSVPRQTTTGSNVGLYGTSGAFGSRSSGYGTRGGFGGSSIGSIGSQNTFSTGRTGRSGTAGTFGTSTGGFYGGFAGRGLSSTAAAAASDLAGQVYVVADEDTNSLLVTTDSRNFQRVQAILADLDRAVPQVLIKVLVAEVSHDNSLDLGVEFSGMNLRASGMGVQAGTNFSVAAQTAGFTFKLDERNVTAAIQALAGVAKLDVLSRPYILTGDNQQATIMVGQDVPFITSSQITTEGQVINTIQYSPIGIILQVTPHINPQGLVTLDVYPEISAATGETVPLNQFASSPVFARRFAQSRVAILDGQTIVIGGLMEDRITRKVDKVPFLGDLPGIGVLFQRTTETKTKTELLIFLTPHVAQQPGALKEMSADEQRGLRIVPQAVEPGAFQEHMRGMSRGAAASQPATRPSDIRIIEAPSDTGAERADRPAPSGARPPADDPAPARPDMPPGEANHGAP